MAFIYGETIGMRARQASIAIARMTSARSASSEGEVPHSPWFLYSLPSQIGHLLLPGESTGIYCGGTVALQFV